MIPRLPPLLLAVLGGASIYGIKYVIDRFEPKALGPPGSSEHYERVFKYRQNMKRLGVAAAVSGALYGGYWIYESRIHRNSPAVLSNDNQDFYEDQYREREKRFALEIKAMKQKEREKEEITKEQLDKEIFAMGEALKKNNKV